MSLIKSILSFFRQEPESNQQPSKITYVDSIPMQSSLIVHLDRRTLYFYHETSEPFESVLEWWYMHTSVPYFVLNKDNMTAVLERSSIKAIILKRK